MIGGGGEKKTLRLVAQYADACNVFGSPEAIARKYAILASTARRSAATPTRSSARPSRTSGSARPTPAGTETPGPGRRPLRRASDAGAQHVIFELKDVHRPATARDRRPGHPAGAPRAAAPDRVAYPREYGDRDTMDEP